MAPPGAEDIPVASHEPWALQGGVGGWLLHGETLFGDVVSW